MKLLVRLFTVGVITICLVMVCCNFMFVEIREREFQTAVTIASHHLTDSYLKQKELLGGLSIEKYKKNLEEGNKFYETLSIENYQGEIKEKVAKDGNKEILRASVRLDPNYDLNNLPSNVAALNINIVNVVLDKSFVMEGVYYTEDGFEKKAVLVNEKDKNGSGEYLFGTNTPSNKRSVYIRYYKQGYEKTTTEPLYFYTDEDFKNYFEHDVRTQINTVSDLKFNYRTADVITGVMDVTVETKFKSLGSVKKELSQIVNTIDSVYPSRDFVDEIIQNNNNHQENIKRTFIDWFNSKGYKLEDLKPNGYWLHPLDFGKYNISAKTWFYGNDFQGGALHFGVDFAATKNTPIKAPGNGLIVTSSKGCPDGGLGSTCRGSSPYANGGGGNQIAMILEINNSWYGINIYHMSNLWIHEEGIVNQGDLIGYVGTSGNSTGPHAHIEMTYLGSHSDVKDGWDKILNTPYTSSFNAGWGQQALGNRCENVLNKKDCRVSAMDYFTTPDFEVITSKYKSVIKIEGAEYYVIKTNPFELELIETKYVNGTSYDETKKRVINPRDYLFTHNIEDVRFGHRYVKVYDAIKHPFKK